MKKALVCGAGGFIGWHLVKRLKEEGFHVVGVDIKNPEFDPTLADKFELVDLRIQKDVEKIFQRHPHFDEVYQLAAWMGGAGVIFTGDNDADIMYNSEQINLNIINMHDHYGKIFFSSSACIYPQEIQEETENQGLKEEDAYPASPDSDYGFGKLYSERLYLSFARNYGVDVRIARFHNIFGPCGSWCNGKEKAPAAMCRKVAEAKDGGEVEIWGDGEQGRSFLYIDECIEGVRRLMDSEVKEPLNIGSDEMISINNLALMVADIAEKKITLKHIDGPLGVRGRNSDNSKIEELLGWRPTKPLREGIEKLYAWIEEQVNKQKGERDEKDS